MSRASKGALNLLRTCARMRRHEKVLIVTDSDTDPAVAATIMHAAIRLGAEACVVTMKTRVLPGDEPPAPVLAAMLSSDLVIAPTSRTMFHTNARTAACRRGARFMSMAGATMSVLSSNAMFADFEKQERVLTRVVELLTRAQRITVTNKAGTDLKFDVRRRRGHGVSGMCKRPGEATGTPDIEAYVAPLEDSANGILVVDGSTSVTGLLRQPLKMHFDHGAAQWISGGLEAQKFLRILRGARSHDAYRIGEFGIGLNPLAHIRGAIIENEASLGTAHIALGNNLRMGGNNRAPVHIDMVLKSPHVEFDGRTILDRKRLVL